MTLAAGAMLLGSIPSGLATLVDDRGQPFDIAALRNRVVLVRVDYNIAPPHAPALLAGHAAAETDLLSDDYRIRASLPTLRLLTAAGARLVLLTHRGRPQGHANPALSTRPLARRLAQLIGQPVAHVPDCIGRGVEQAVADLPAGEILMLENVRFHLGEQLNQPQFVRALARLGEVFVNEAFPTLHRAHASLSGLAAAVPTSLLGLRIQHELRLLLPLQGAPDSRKLTLVLGSGGDGAYARLQASGSFDLLGRLLGQLETLMIGGVLANTFLAARDFEIGRSRYEPAFLETARDFLAEAGVRGCRVLLPQDLRVVGSGRAEQHGLPESGFDPHIRPVNRLGAHELTDDVGPRTASDWAMRLQAALTLEQPVVWLDSLGLPHSARASDRALLAAVSPESADARHALLGGESLLHSLRQHGGNDSYPGASSGSAVVLAALAGQGLPALQVLQARRNGGWVFGDRRVG